MTNEWPLLPTLTSEGLYASVNGPLLRDKGTNNGISIGDWRLPAEQTCDRGSVPQNDGPTTIDDMTMSIRYVSHDESALLAASFYDHRIVWALLVVACDALYTNATLRLHGFALDPTGSLARAIEISTRTRDRRLAVVITEERSGLDVEKVGCMTPTQSTCVSAVVSSINERHIHERRAANTTTRSHWQPRTS